MSLPVTNYDTNIRAVAIIIDHRTTSKLNLNSLIVSHSLQAVNHWIHGVLSVKLRDNSQRSH
ncbi:hypothetical protein PANT111_140104 [Pantoea brenneri]|uniref:Uncharacterized protein n=1 Tax=Pantoea brenneri TaxID=472694 RepID=A0AAX3J2U7_9GAMM|nr:hypothetical protein PANT111_140104 [Pantoea brenneri]